MRGRCCRRTREHRPDTVSSLLPLVGATCLTLAPSVLIGRHYSRWGEVHSLVLDGVAFSRARLGVGGKRGGGYQTVPTLRDSAEAGDGHDSISSGSGGGGGKDKGKRSSGSSKEKSSIKEGRKDSGGGKSKSKKEKGSKSSKSKGGTAGESVEAPPPPEETVAQKQERMLQEQRDEDQGVHSSQQRITVVGLNG